MYACSESDPGQGLLATHRLLASVSPMPPIVTTLWALALLLLLNPLCAADLVKNRGAQPVYAYITNQGTNNVSVIDTATNTVVTTVGVGGNPYGVAVNPAGTRAFVGNLSDGTVSVIDTANQSVLATLNVGTFPYGMAVNPAGTRLYVANEQSNNVTVLDAVTHQFVATVAVGSYPRGVVVNPSGTRVYVVNNGTANVSVIDSATQAVVATVAVGASPIGIAINPAGTRAYVTNGNSSSVSVIDTATDTVLGTISVGTAPTGIAVNAAGTRAYVARTAANAVSVIDLASNAVVGSVAVGTSPLGIAINPSDSHVYVANIGSNNVSVIASASNTVVSTVAVGSTPVAFGAFITPPPVVIPPPTFTVHDADRFGDPAAAGIAGVNVTLLTGTQVIDAVTSDALGNFSFNAAVDLSQPYTLRLAGFGLQRAYQSVVPANLGATPLVLPINLHTRLDSEFVRLETTDIQVAKYDTTNARALLSNWSSAQLATAAVHAARDHALGRLLVASEGLANLYSGTHLLNFASARLTVNLAASALALAKFEWDLAQLAGQRVGVMVAQGGATQAEADLANASVATAAALAVEYAQEFLGFRSFLTEWGQDQVGTGATLTGLGVLDAFHAEAWNDVAGREAQLAAVVDVLAADVGAAVISSSYVEQTQGDFDLSVARTGAFEGGGTVGEGFVASQQHAAMVLQRNGDQALASQDGNPLREAWRLVADYALIYDPPGELFPAAGLLSTAGDRIISLSLSDLTHSGASDYGMVHETAFHDAPVVAGRAFDPSLPPLLGAAIDLEFRFAQPSGVVPSEYSSRLAALRGRLAINDRPGAIAEAQGLVAADAALEVAIETELLQLLALTAANPIDPLATAQRATVARAGVLAGERIALYGQLAGYVIANFAIPGTSNADVIAQIDDVSTAVATFDNTAANAQAAAAGLTAPSHVVVPEHGLSNNGAPSQTPPGAIVVRARVVNAGQQPATGVVVALSFGPTPGPVPVALLTSPSVVELQTLAVGETRVVTWTAIASDSSPTGTGSAATYHVEVSATSGVTDDADGSFEVLASLISIFGDGFEPE